MVEKNVHVHQYGLLPIGSSAITEIELEPWFDLDLGEKKIIEHIDIWNTVELNGHQKELLSTHFRNFYVLVSDVPFTNMDLAAARANANHEYYKDGKVLRWYHLDDLNIKGRYIRLQGEGFTKIGIAEIDVIGRIIPPAPDCNGVAGGSAYLDKCDICVKGNTGLEPCEMDCALVWGGTAYIDNCGTCVGGTTGKVAPIEITCNGIDDDCNPATLDAPPGNDADGDGVCDANDLCTGADPGTPCSRGLTCVSSFTITDDCNCGSVATIPTGLTNLALNKTATQSSTAYSADASRAVDGNTNGNFGSGSVTHTDNNMNAWWEVDLAAIEDISIINIHNRAGGTASRLNDFYVLVSDVPFTSTSLSTTLAQSGVTAYHFTTYPNPNMGFVVNRTGRYIRIQLTGQNNLNIAEVEIIENCNCSADVDNDFVCDDVDACIGHDDSEDADNDGIPDGCDNCDNTTIGTPCNDGNDCTYNDIRQADCSCVGTFYNIAPDKIVNGSFETGGFDGWGKQYNWGSGAGNITIGNNGYCDGSYGIEYTGNGATEQLYNDFSGLMIGNTYTIYFWMSGDDADCHIGSTNNVYAGTYYYVAGNGTNTYIQQSLTFTATATVMRIWFDLYPNSSIKMDAFSFENNTCNQCSDGIQNGDEKGIDCGGSSCVPCVLGCMTATAHNYDATAKIDYCNCETCDDGIQNGDETEVDCGGANCDACTALPVELVSFTGRLVKESTLLKWETALEENTKGFEIERSRDSNPDIYRGWENIGFKDANNVGSRYEFWDNSPYNGNNYYRLKIVDNDNSFEYTNIVTVFLETTSSTLRAFPNPTTGVFTIEGMATPNTLLELEVVDVLGQTIWEGNTMSDSNGSILQMIGIGRFAAGMYYLKWNDGINFKTLPIVKAE
ncbi:MAG: discoidin domain-containing protein [Saprospiraceae bacterium]